MTIIPPETIVERIRSLRGRGLLTPDDEETLWFLHYAVNRREGGIERLARDIVERFPEWIGPSEFQACQHQKRLTTRQAAEFWQSVPEFRQGEFESLFPDPWILEVYDLEPGAKWPIPAGGETSHNVEVCALKALLTRAALKDVESALRGVCLGYNDRFDCWAFPQLSKALREIIDTNARTASSQLADTSVTRKIFDALNFAWQEGVMVRIEGDPRHGKTEAINTYCKMYPGRARLVTVPSETTEEDFFGAVAKGLGIDTENLTVRDLRRRIDYILEHSRLMLICDESHFLLPQKYSENTPPVRMNWVRTRVADRGLPAALLITPQSFDHAFRQYIKKTNYRFDQFFGRTALFKLPKTLSKEDVISVAQIHFPDIKLPLLKLIAARAMQNSGYLQAVEFTAKRARYLANLRRPGAVVTSQDVSQAIEDIMPGKPTRQPTATDMHEECSIDEMPAQGANRISALGREVNRVSEELAEA